MKNIILLLIIYFTASCTLTRDFEFRFIRNKQEFKATGTAAAAFKKGDTLKIKVEKRPVKRCTLVIIDGNHHFKKNCKGKKGTFLIVDMGKVNPRSLKTVAMSLVRKGEDTLTGKLYLGLANAQYEGIELDYECPYEFRSDNQFTCMRPEGFKFIFSIYPEHAGKVQISSADCGGERIEQVFSVSAGNEIEFTIKPTHTIVSGDKKIVQKKKGYCPLRVDFIDRIQLSSTLHVDFYEI